MRGNLVSRACAGELPCDCSSSSPRCRSRRLRARSPAGPRRPARSSTGPRVTRESKPWTRWWWLGSAVDEANLTREIASLDSAGFGGVEVTVIYGAKGADSVYIPYLSPRWVDVVRHAATEADAAAWGSICRRDPGDGGPRGRRANIARSRDSVPAAARDLAGHVEAIVAVDDGRRVRIHAARVATGRRRRRGRLRRRHALLRRQRQAPRARRRRARDRSVLGGGHRALSAHVRRPHGGVAARHDPLVLPRLVRVHRRRLGRALPVLPLASRLRPRRRAARARGARRRRSRRARAVRLSPDARRDAAREFRRAAHALVARARRADARAGARLSRQPARSVRGGGHPRDGDLRRAREPGRRSDDQQVRVVRRARRREAARVGRVVHLARRALHRHARRT